jgi:DNA repair protein RecO (recombination protein O)
LTNHGEITAALILRSVDFGEADRILTLFTRSRGKISALARGARKSQRRFGGALEPFALFEATLGPKRRGSLWPIQEASLVTANEGLSRSLGRLSAASYWIELIRESLPEADPVPEIFHHAEVALGLMAEAREAILPALVIAGELKLLRLMGMAMGITACTACGRPVPKGRPVLVHPGRGGVVCTPCGGGPMSMTALSLAEMQSLDEAPLADATRTALSRDQAMEIEHAIGAFIAYHLERPLPTRTYYLSVITG